MKERIVRFGEGSSLLGLVTLPERAATGAMAVVFLNAGIIHRIGPNRLNVKLARRAAAAGVPALRFDLSGLGDSPPARAALGFEQQAVHDIGLAFDALTGATGCSRFVIVGLCSGADNAMLAALADARVCGLLLLDTHAYQTTEAKLAYLAPRALDPARWGRVIAKGVSRAREKIEGALMDAGAVEAAPQATVSDNGRVTPPREEFSANLRRLLARGVRISILYSKTVETVINADRQFYRAFPELAAEAGLDVKVWGHVDHTYTTLAAQGELKAHLVAFLEATAALSHDGGKVATIAE